MSRLWVIAAALDVLDERLAQRGVVVPVVERAGAGEEVDVLAARLVLSVALRPV